MTLAAEKEKNNIGSRKGKKKHWQQKRKKTTLAAEKEKTTLAAEKEKTTAGSEIITQKWIRIRIHPGLQRKYSSKSAESGHAKYECGSTALCTINCLDRLLSGIVAALYVLLLLYNKGYQEG